MSGIHVETLQGLVLPEASAHRRDHALPAEARDAAYLARYDDRTLVYDAVELASGRVLVTCPALLNLRALLRTGLRRGGRAARIRRHWSVATTDMLTLGGTGPLSVSVDGAEHALPIRRSRAADFAGRNAVMTINRNNALDWIRDWLGFYIRMHGLDAAVIFDNGSDHYSPGDLAETMASAGLKAGAVYSAPFPYGAPVKSPDGRRNGLLLQISLMNLARRDMLSLARAVLNADIDELVETPQGQSVFDMAVARRHSMVKIHGHWVYPAPGTPLPALQRLHSHRAEPERRCAQKWCAVPSGLLSRFGWTPHHVGGPLVRLVPVTPGTRLHHCRATATGWNDNRFDAPAKLVHDTALTALIERGFPE